MILITSCLLFQLIKKWVLLAGYYSEKVMIIFLTELILKSGNIETLLQQSQMGTETKIVRYSMIPF